MKTFDDLRALPEQPLSAQLRDVAADRIELLIAAGVEPTVATDTVVRLITLAHSFGMVAGVTQAQHAIANVSAEFAIRHAAAP